MLINPDIEKQIQQYPQQRIRSEGGNQHKEKRLIMKDKSQLAKEQNKIRQLVHHASGSGTVNQMDGQVGKATGVQHKRSATEAAYGVSVAGSGNDLGKGSPLAPRQLGQAPQQQIVRQKQQQQSLQRKYVKQHVQVPANARSGGPGLAAVSGRGGSQVAHQLSGRPSDAALAQQPSTRTMKEQLELVTARQGPGLSPPRNAQEGSASPSADIISNQQIVAASPPLRRGTIDQTPGPAPALAHSAGKRQAVLSKVLSARQNQSLDDKANRYKARQVQQGIRAHDAYLNLKEKVRPQKLKTKSRGDRSGDGRGRGGRSNAEEAKEAQQIDASAARQSSATAKRASVIAGNATQPADAPAEEKTGLANFDIVKKIGDGAYSQVYKVRRHADGALYALKRVNLPHFSTKEKENAINEVRILASMRHPNVVQYKEAFVDEKTQNLCIVMEYANHGDVFQKINRHKEMGTYIKERLIWKIIIQAVMGLESMHKLNIMHRDLKSANIFLKGLSASESQRSFVASMNRNEDQSAAREGNNQADAQNGSPDGKQDERDLRTPDIVVAKLGDMNVSKVSNSLGLNYTQTGTPYYASPEVWKDEPYDNKSDVWSLGCVIYEMAALRPPFQANDMQGLFKKLIKGNYQKLPAHFSSDLTHVIDLMLQVNPKRRISTSQLLDDAVFKKRTQKYFGTLYDKQTAKNQQQNVSSEREPKKPRSNVRAADRDDRRVLSKQALTFQKNKSLQVPQGVLLKTIRIPKNLNMLGGRLPKKNYESNATAVDAHEYGLSLLSIGQELPQGLGGVDPEPTKQNIAQRAEIEDATNFSQDNSEEMRNRRSPRNVDPSSQQEQMQTNEPASPSSPSRRQTADRASGEGTLEDPLRKNGQPARLPDHAKPVPQNSRQDLTRNFKKSPQNSSKNPDLILPDINSQKMPAHAARAGIDDNLEEENLRMAKNNSVDVLNRQNEEHQQADLMKRYDHEQARMNSLKSLKKSSNLSSNLDASSRPYEAYRQHHTVENEVSMNSSTVAGQNLNDISHQESSALFDRSIDQAQAESSRLNSLDDLMDGEIHGHGAVAAKKIGSHTKHHSGVSVSLVPQNKKLKVVLPKNLERIQIINVKARKFTKYSEKDAGVEGQPTAGSGAPPISNVVKVTSKFTSKGPALNANSYSQSTVGEGEVASHHEQQSLPRLRNDLGASINHNNGSQLPTQGEAHGQASSIAEDPQISPSQRKVLRKNNQKLSYDVNYSQSQKNLVELPQFASDLKSERPNLMNNGNTNGNSIDSSNFITATDRVPPRRHVNHDLQPRPSQMALQDVNALHKDLQQQFSTRRDADSNSLGKPSYQMKGNHYSVISQRGGDSIDANVQNQIMNIAQILQNRQQQRGLLPKRAGAALSIAGGLNNREDDQYQQQASISSLQNLQNKKKLRHIQRAAHLGTRKNAGLAGAVSSSMSKNSIMKLPDAALIDEGSVVDSISSGHAGNGRIIINNNKINIGQLVFTSSPNTSTTPSLPAGAHGNNYSDAQTQEQAAIMSILNQPLPNSVSGGNLQSVESQPSHLKLRPSLANSIKVAGSSNPKTNGNSRSISIPKLPMQSYMGNQGQQIASQLLDRGHHNNYSQRMVNNRAPIERAYLQQKSNNSNQKNFASHRFPSSNSTAGIKLPGGAASSRFLIRSKD